MKIVADKDIPFLRNVLEPFADVIYLKGSEITTRDVIDADALLIRTRTRCDGSLLKNSKVKFIGTATIGSEHIDKEYCEKNSITWVAAEGCNSNAVLQYISSTLIHLSDILDFNLGDKVLGVVGVGNIGKKVVQLAELLGMQVLLNDPPRERVEGICGFHSLQILQQECDIITFHVPLTHSGEDKTFHLCDEHFLSKVNKGTIIINSSRGGVIDEKALFKYLSKQHLSGSVLDVYEKEPSIDPLLHEKLTLATYHIAGYSLDGKANGTTAVVSKLSDFFDLHISSWTADIDEDDNLKIEIDCTGKNFLQLFREVGLQIYPVIEDDRVLRGNPHKFEEFRNNYNFRRDFTAWKLKLINCDDVSKRKFRKLGFRITS
jgi:erythronate-4-phosphate dehydrogenase